MAVALLRSQYAQRTRQEVINNDKEIASAVRSALADKVGLDHFYLWFDDGAVFSYEDQRLVVTVAGQFRAERLQRGYRDELAAVCREVIGVDTRIEFRVDAAVAPQPVVRLNDSSHAGPSDQADRPPAAAATRREAADGGSARPEFPEFIQGGEHGVALASLDMVLQQPGKVTPLFLHGPSGSGKTHFLEHVRREARRRAGLRRIVSVSAEQFTTQFLEALQGKGMPNFRSKFRDVELLLIDDLQFFNGKKQTLGELQTTIDHLIRERRQLVLAADRSPYELAAFSSDLVGRLRGGVVCSLPYPSEPTRRQMAQQLADQHGGLPSETLDLIAARLQGDARQVAGAVYRLLATQQASPAPLTAAAAEEALDDLFRAAARTVRLADIEEAICDVFGLEKQALHTEDRRKHISQPRMLAMWLARKHTRAGLSEICRFFGKRSHSTVVSAERQVRSWLDRGAAVRLMHGDFPIADAIRRVESQLRTG